MTLGLTAICACCLSNVWIESYLVDTQTRDLMQYKKWAYNRSGLGIDDLVYNIQNMKICSRICIMPSEWHFASDRNLTGQSQPYHWSCSKNEIKTDIVWPECLPMEGLKELRPVLEGFFITIHESTCEQRVPIPRTWMNFCCVTYLGIICSIYLLIWVQNCNITMFVWYL